MVTARARRSIDDRELRGGDGSVARGDGVTVNKCPNSNDGLSTIWLDSLCSFIQIIIIIQCKKAIE